MNLNYIGHNQWHGQDFPNFFTKVQSQKWDKIILFCQNEWEWHMHDPVYFPQFYEYCQKINQPIHVISGSHEYLYPVSLDNVVVHWWDTYWIGKTYQELINKNQSTPINPYEFCEYKYHFICMNNRAHHHRLLLIDLLAKHNLIEDNAVSLHENSDLYEWQYFNFKQLLLEPEFTIDKQQHRIPDQYYDSFAQLISESSSNTIMLSEKTAIPLIIGKPFLIAGQMHFHRFLQGLGFQLYDEIFDYSFDNEPNEETRYEMLLENFKKLQTIAKPELINLQKKIAHKIDFNKRKARTIAYDLNLYPKIALEVIEYYKQTGIEIDKSLVRNHLMLEMYRDYDF